MLHWIVLATSWNILSGYSGYFSFGHGAFFGAGIYTTATLPARYDVAVPVDAAGRRAGRRAARAWRSAPSCSASRRVRGELFALLTLAVTFVVATIVAQHADRRRPGRLADRGAGAEARRRRRRRPFYLLALAAAALTLLIAWAHLRVASFGAGLFAIHDDEDAAEVMGVPTYRYKLVAFAHLVRAGRRGRRHPRAVRLAT